MLQKIDKYAHIGPAAVRIGVSLVFLWFGYQQLTDVEAWIGYVPQSVVYMVPVGVETLVYFNGVFEIIFGMLLILGFFTRLAALLLALHMFHLVTIVGYNEIGVRDFGLAMATLSVFFSGADRFSLQSRLQKKKQAEQSATL